MMYPPVKTRSPVAEIVGGRSIVAPVRGWNVRDPDSTMKAGYAKYLENLVPTGSTVDLRPGVSSHKTGFAKPVKSLMGWMGADGTKKLFGATDDGLFDSTNSGAIAATVQALTNGWCTHVNYRTSAASFLIVVNGVDTLKTFDGTTWASVASYSISGGGTLTSSDIINLAVHNRRLWLIEKNSGNAFYFDINAASGTVFRFPLGGYMSKGGFLLAAYTWTMDGGDGTDDRIAFITSEGQVIIYVGTDPATIPSTFQLQGVYALPRPIGRKCGYKLGGDVYLLTEGGVFSLASLTKGKAVTPDLAVSDLIRPEISAATQLYNANRGWQIMGLLSRNILLVNVPTTEASKAYQYGMNTISQGWWKNTGWDALCFEEFDNKLFAGFFDKVGQAWNGALDFSTNVTGYGRSHYDYLGERTRYKNWTLFRPIVRTAGSVSVTLRLDVDFSQGSDYGPTLFGVNGGAVFDSALWDGATWADDQRPNLDWKTPGAKPGYCAAARLRVVSNGGTFSWSVTDMIYEPGARVVG